MKKSTGTKTRNRVVFSLVILGLMAAIIVLPDQFRSKAVNAGQDGSERTVAPVKGLEYYDIRTDKSQAETLLGFRRTAGRNAVTIADARDQFVVGENALRASVPTLKIEYNEDIRTPEVIAPDVNRGRAVLTGASSAKHSDVLRRFAADNGTLIGLRGGQAGQLKVTADYTNPDGNLSYAHLEQFINDVPVFRGEIKAGFTKQGEMFRVINNLAPDLDYNSLSTDFGDPADAVGVASRNLNYELKTADSIRSEANSTNLKTVFGSGDWATTAEKMYFPTEPGVARAAWRVLIWEPVNAFYVIVDSETGTVLWRKNITDDQTQAATYSVYTNPLSMVNVAESPAPITPGPTNPATGTQGTQITRSNVTLIGNEGSLSFNNLGWITDNTNGANGWTDGNAVEAGLDIVAPNGVDAPVNGVGRVFNFDYNPAPGLPAPPDDITSTNFRNGIVTQLFYINNRYHDELYKLGFTEAARNFQNDNFGRTGAAADRVSAEAQDSSGTNNANFATPADGGRGRMQMYRFTQTPARDGDIDADVVIHEHTHGLSNRLIGNASGLGNNRGGSMGEGWSDFYGLALLSQESDPATGIYTTGAYVTFNSFGIGTTNSYYGIRRFPYSLLSNTGGASNRPYNPLTFADLNTGCVLSDGAYPPSPPFAGNACNEVHNAGEVWASLLWEVRAKFIQRLGFAVGNRRVLQFVTDGMKLTANAPTFIVARNAIIQAAQAGGVSADVADVREGFRIRGMGFSATDNGTLAVEAFDQANVLLAPGFAVSDAPGDNDGFPEPGENVILTVPITNSTGSTVNTVTANVTGGGSADYGSIGDGQTVVRQISYTIPASAVCGSLFTVTINITSAIGTRVDTASFRLGKPNFTGTTQNFDGVTAPALPAGWSQTNSGANTGWVTATDLVSSAPNTAFAPSPITVGEANLMTTASITSASAQLAFKNFYNTESTFDGMVLEIQIGGTAYQDITAAGGSFVSGGYNLLMSSSSPFGARMAWSGTSAGFLNTLVNLPAAANGQTINLRWRTASDSSVTASGIPGTRVDDVVLTGGTLLSGYDCMIGPAAPSKARADFDGDGKTDISVFRPGSGTWFLNRSQAGFSAVSFGSANDRLVPADYDGDGKTDVAIARPNAANTELNFYILNSGNSTVSFAQWGLPTDIPTIGDYDNDGKADIAVFRPSEGIWYIRSSGSFNRAIRFGLNGDVPVPGDYDGDGKTDIAVKRGNVWYINKSTGGVQTTAFGATGDQPVPADYDGNGTTDIAVYRPSNGTWYTSLNAATNYGAVQFGNSTDVPVPGDYDGDGKTDLAVYRSGTWFIRSATGGFAVTNFGTAADLPIPKQYIP